MAGFNTVHRTETVRWEHSGKNMTLKIRRPNFATEGAFGRFLSERALHTIQRHRNVMGEKDYKEAVSAWACDCAIGKYDWGSTAVEEAVWNTKTLKELLFLIVTQDPIDRPFDSRDMFDVAWESENDVGLIRDQLIEAFFKVMAPSPDPKNPSPSQPEVAADKS